MVLKFGAHYGGEPAKKDVVEYAQRLEALGFDGFWSTEGSMRRDCFSILSAAAAVCDLDLGTAVLVVPFREPTMTARTIATLDQLSGGKVIVGVGVAGERLAEFDAYGINAKERGPRTNEALDLMIRLWQEKDVNYEGRFFNAKNSTLTIRPFQQPHPPIWVGGRLGGQGKSRDAALRRLARYGDGWLPYLVSPEQYSVGLGRIADYASQYGREGFTFTRGLQVYVGIYPTHQEALDVAMAGTARGYGLNQEQAERYLSFGTVDEVTQSLAAYADAGAEYFVIQWACRREDVAGNLDILSKQILPALKARQPQSALP